MNGEILITACSLINSTRQDDYGPPLDSFKRLAAMWSAYLGHEVSAKDVAICLTLLKLSRESHRHKQDNLLDAAGYIGLAADLVKNEVS